MQRLEKTSTINDSALLLASMPPPAVDVSLDPGQISANVHAVTPPSNPWILPSISSAPGMPPRADELNLNMGLGQVSLQPVIDGLNQFKTMCLNVIQTKREAIGPEATKDSNLAAGAVLVTKQVLEAAKSYTKAIKDINNLIQSYVSAIDIIFMQIIKQISLLQNQIQTIMNMVTGDYYYKLITSVAIKALLMQLKSTTDITVMLTLIIQIEAELIKLEREATKLSQTYDRVNIRFNAEIKLLKNAIYSLMHYTKIRDSLKGSRQAALSAIMIDDYLDGFNLDTYTSLSFDWSLTNSAGLTQYSLIDDQYHLIDRLNAMCKSFDPNHTSPIIIESKQDNGTIVVPDGGILFAGLDPAATPGVSLFLELVIDNGATIISTQASGDPATGTDPLVTHFGKYVNRGDKEINFSQCIKKSNDTYQLTLLQNSAIPKVGDLYIFTTPGGSRPISYTLEYDVDGSTVVPVDMPMPFEVMDTSHNTVLVQRWNQTKLSHVDYFIDMTGKTNLSYSEDLELDIPDSSNRIYMSASTLRDDYIVADSTNTIILDSNSNFMTTLSLPLYFSGNYIPSTWNTYVATIVDPFDPNYNKYVYYNYASVLTLSLYTFNGISDTPHSGDKIKCKNWVLRTYVSGNVDKVRSLRFSRTNSFDSAYIFFMRAHFGFIPADAIK